MSPSWCDSEASKIKREKFEPNKVVRGMEYFHNLPKPYQVNLTTDCDC